MTPPIQTRDQARARARTLRADLARAGRSISHARALEQVAHAEGFASWNHLSARLSNMPEEPLQLGDRVCGTYLGQPFRGVVHAVRTTGGGEAYQIELALDDPVDVVTFPTFSSWRRRIRATISSGGVSFTRTSDGTPHLVATRDDGGWR